MQKPNMQKTVLKMPLVHLVDLVDHKWGARVPFKCFPKPPKHLPNVPKSSEKHRLRTRSQQDKV